ncbi:hypothetical protein M6G63_26045 (plasmid) [Pseudomonas sp. BYT-5]|uniref:hypothetical protein n=1 Tax=unclassified Pseudomonas TaxID=196821 RepID=UPI0020222B57|nr:MULTISPECIES: hypothetical protein [unclassified Pseudomonas]URD45479.1 hypothetical protein M6G63_26045 [Pseudomonas sp. BYT-5]URL00696.1 hypothetical protein J5X93_27220 [Pseudomonas sp. BYT-1]
MSGSSTTRDDYPTYTDACDQLNFTAQLASPKEEVVEQLEEGCVLDIVTGEQNGQAVVHALWQGQVAGGIAAQQLQRLRQCLAEGTIYAARVLSINNGQVRVRVFPANIH